MMISGRRLLLLLVLTAVLPACRDDAADSTADATVTMTATTQPAPTQTPTPVPTSRPTPTVVPSPTPLVPAISADAQRIDDEGVVVLASVTMPQDGLVVVHAADADGEPAAVIGTAVAPAGNSAALSVPVDVFQATATLVAVLYNDTGTVGELDPTDTPLTIGSEPVAARFAVEIEIPLPAIIIADQVVDTGGVVTVERVVLPAGGWVVLYAARGGSLADPLAFSYVDAGVSENVTLVMNYRRADRELIAALYLDEGEARVFEPDLDRPVLVQGEAVSALFAATLPIDIFVLDQPVFDGQIVVERVLTPVPSWLAIYTDVETGVGRIIGLALLEPGLNENLVVDVVENLVTEELVILIHEDLGVAGEFDFPGTDNPILVDGRLPDPYIFRTNPGNYIIGQDQNIGPDSDVIVPLIVVDSPAWIVIYNDADGARGDIIGQTALPAGLHHDVSIVIDGARQTPTLYAVLHLDAGTIGEFEFPEGLDVPFQRNRNVIETPFVLEEG